MDRAIDISSSTALETVHSSFDKQTCSHCSKEFKNKSQYENHLKTHKDQKPHREKLLECSACRKRFCRKDHLIRHLRKHEVVTASTCKFCNKPYANRAHLKRHELAHAETGFHCRHCSESFASEDERNRHVEMEHRKNCVCSGCNRSFRTDESLARHRKTFCQNEISGFVCESCGKQFKLRGNLKVHAESKCGTLRTYRCETCGKSYMTRPSLATHRLIHTGEKNFVCGYCGKAHRTKAEVRRHELVHTREKPFACRICLKAFAHRESLMTHSTIHTGVRPYVCDECGKGFSCIGNLTKHRRNNAGCATADRRRNRPRVRKPMFRSLLAGSSEEFPFAAVGPCEGLAKLSMEHNIPAINYTVVDTVLSLPKPVTDPDLPDTSPHRPQGAPKEIKEEEMERDLDLKCLANGSMIDSTRGAHIDCNNSAGLWDVDMKSTHADYLKSELGNDNHEGDKLATESHVKTQTSDDSENATRERDPNHSACGQTLLQPFVNVESSENAVTMRLRCLRGLSTSVGALAERSRLEEDRLSPRSEETSVECDFEENRLDDNSLDSDSISAKTGERKPNSLYEDQYLSWVKSNDPVSEDAAESKGTVPPNPVSLNVPNEEERLRWHVKVHELDSVDGQQCRLPITSNTCAQSSERSFVDGVKREGSYVSEDDEPLAVRLSRRFPSQYRAERFENEGKYRRHKAKCHVNAARLTFPCPHCPNVYKSVRALSRHEPRHTGGTFRCKKCEQTFTVFKDYQQHLRTNHWKKFSCDRCGRSFQQSSELRSHVVCNHGPGGKGLRCEACGKPFKHEVNLRRHVESRCGASPRFICKTCGRAYLSQGGFESHQRTHAGLRSFLCGYCGRDFLHKSVLLIHELTHTGERPFVCVVCSKAFAHRISLTTHASVHGGTKPYLCEGCGAGFSCFGNLKKHRLTHMSTCSRTRIRKSK